MSFGFEKNFPPFMQRYSPDDGSGAPPDAGFFKATIAKAVVYRKVQALVRPMFPAYQGNVATYVVAVAANKIGTRFDATRVWQQQDISPAFRHQLGTWAHEVHAALQASSGGKMISEWAKRPECWEYVKSAKYSPIQPSIPEVR